MSGRPLILIDVDGVINVNAGPEAMRELRLNHGWRLRRVTLDGGPELVFYNPRAGEWLRQLADLTGGELAWATLRRGHANHGISPLLGLGRLPVAPVLLEDPKAPRVVPWTQGRPFVWFEDLAEECELADELAGDQPHKMIRVDPRTGLTLQDARSAARWLMSIAAARWPAGE